VTPEETTALEFAYRAPRMALALFGSFTLLAHWPPSGCSGSSRMPWRGAHARSVSESR
jgi:hypothetical protein